VKQMQRAKTGQRRSGSSGRPPGRGRRTLPQNQSDSGQIDGRSWRQRMELAQVLGAFLPQDHSAAKRLRGHLYRADLPLAVGSAQHLKVFADAVVLDDVPAAIAVYTGEQSGQSNRGMERLTAFGRLSLARH
jgi:hypothetical protein